jgi:hypothetical protein
VTEFAVNPRSRTGLGLAGTEAGRVRVLLVFDGENEAEIHRRLADDAKDFGRLGGYVSDGDSTLRPG